MRSPVTIALMYPLLSYWTTFSVFGGVKYIFAAKLDKDPTYIGRRVNKPLQFASPLQSFTLRPKNLETVQTPRERFLSKFRVGLSAERRARDILARERDLYDDEDMMTSGTGDAWDKVSEERERLRWEKDQARIERVFDHAIERHEANIQVKEPVTSSSIPSPKYQFVGVVQNPKKGGKKVTWYARKRSNDSKWNVRLVHANKDAILRNMFLKGKIDIYGKYKNIGLSDDTTEISDGDNIDGEDKSSLNKLRHGKPSIQADYTVKPRSWCNLWNFNLKHFFTDSSGAFWRERRLPSGLYTDGQLVYESVYRYTDGKNGMKPVSSIQALLKSNTIAESTKKDLLNRLQHDSPDVIIED